MTETTQAAASTQAANGQAPSVPPAPDLSDTGEKWLGVLVIAAGVFLLIVGLDRVTNGALSRRFSDDGG